MITQPRYSLDTMMARATDLFAQGYRVSPSIVGLFRVVSPAGEIYYVDAERYTCECQAFERGLYHTRSGHKTCKHLFGLRLLVLSQIESLMLAKEQKACFFTPEDRGAYRALESAASDLHEAYWQCWMREAA